MLKVNEQLLNNSIQELGYKNKLNLHTDKLLIDLYKHSQEWLKSQSNILLPCNPMPEKHPYKEQMPIDLNFKKYIIGTFPPISYISDIYEGIGYCNGYPILKPIVPFFHGNRQKLWQYLIPKESLAQLSSDRNKRATQIKDFLKEKILHLNNETLYN